jgi:hypothetical protein
MPVPDLLVYYPFGGTKFLLNWWTQYDRGHLAIAASETSLQGVARRIFQENPGARIDALCEAEILAPPLQLCEVAAQEARESAVREFLNNVGYGLKKLLGAGHQLPSFFAVCEEYIPEEGVENNEWARDSHYECTNCTQGFRLLGMVPDEFYDTYHDRWEREVDNRPKYHPNPKHLQPTRSAARRAGDDEVIQAVVGDYGHHSAAVYFTEPGRVGPYTLPVLFYFKHLRDLDRTPYTRMLEKAKAEVAAARKRDEVARYMERKRAADEEINTLLAFFEERARFLHLLARRP